MPSVEVITFDLWDTIVIDDSDEAKRAAAGLNADEKERIGAMAANDCCAGGNPIQFTAEQYAEIFRCSVHGG